MGRKGIRERDATLIVHSTLANGFFVAAIRPPDAYSADGSILASIWPDGLALTLAVSWSVFPAPKGPGHGEGPNNVSLDGVVNKNVIK